jgi:hypothetical protein
MSIHNENKSAARKAIASLINLLKAESDIIGKDNPIPVSKQEQLRKIIGDLEHQLSIYSYLEEHPEKEEKPKEKEPVIVPPPPAYIPAVQFEKIPPEVPVIKEPQQLPNKEIPTSFPPKSQQDLKSFIGFNERLMFLRLFNNSIEEYEKALSQINSCATKEEASAILDVLSTVHKWDKSSEPVQIFHTTVKRRFS